MSADFLTADNEGDVVPCSRWQEGGDDLPGFRYKPGANSGFDEWDFPCVSFDPLNETSKKEAMKRALSTGLEELVRVKKEVMDEMKQEAFKATVQGSNFGD